MMPRNPVRDLMVRTMCNLQIIEQIAADKSPNETRQLIECGPFEVTQLVNSFLAGIAHPWEEYKEELGVLLLEHAKDQGWPLIDWRTLTGDGPKYYGELLGLIRHSFAHGNIEFISDDGKDITSLKFWNNDRKGEPNWEAIGTVLQLRQFLEKFVELAMELPPPPLSRQGRDISPSGGE